MCTSRLKTVTESSAIRRILCMTRLPLCAMRTRCVSDSYMVGPESCKKRVQGRIRVVNNCIHFVYDAFRTRTRLYTKRVRVVRGSYAIAYDEHTLVYDSCTMSLRLVYDCKQAVERRLRVVHDSFAIVYTSHKIVYAPYAMCSRLVCVCIRNVYESYTSRMRFRIRLYTTSTRCVCDSYTCLYESCENRLRAV